MSSIFSSFPNGFRALVIGASGGIGNAFIEYLKSDPHCGLAIGISRSSSPSIDFEDEQSIKLAAAALTQQGPFHLIINAAGILQTDQFSPERKIDQLSYAQMEQMFRVNTMGPALVLQQFGKLLAPQRSVLAIVSAKVGSIGDNRLGGWYSYRASKAAVNMMVKTAAIEVKRRLPNAVIVALHPGTVDTALSAPFKGAQLGRKASTAAADMLATLNQLQPDQSGGFFAYDGEQLPF